ncbi:MAG: peptidase [Cenarchaeum sp. SB0669_bin_11]|nr:peptidase [Cenarchaeum sp. SB0669_bin_11]
MKRVDLCASITLVLFSCIILLSQVDMAMAQFQQGGVDYNGDWHVGEGMQIGDYYSYDMCHVDYKECAEFSMDIWIEKDIQVGTETKWLAHVVTYDGSRITVGQMELGKIAPEPTGGSPELSSYIGAFKSSVVWLSAFANANEPKDFSMPSWGKIANIGGEQILPKELLVDGHDVPAGHFDNVVVVGWRTGGANSQIWVADGFPFPIKALTWTHVSEGIPPREYEFELQEYRSGVTENPFADIESTAQQQSQLGCPSIDGLDQSIKKPSHFFKYQLHVFYSPDPPVEECPMRMLIKFISKYDDTEFLNQVQYDFWVVDVDESGQPLTPPKRSISSDEGRLYLYSPSGQAEIEFIVNEAGMTNYLIYIYGLSKDGVVPPSSEGDYLLVPIDVYSGAKPVAVIPDWIKNTAMWWAEGSIDDESFVQGLQFLIQNGILSIPPTESTGDSTGGAIPDWIKNTAMWWAEGSIDDESFVQGLQFLIQNGILRVS